MTKSDKEFVEMTSKLTAQATVTEFKKTLNCNEHILRIGELEQTVNNGIKDKAEQNTKGILANRKFIFWSILGIFIIVISGTVANYLGG